MTDRPDTDSDGREPDRAQDRAQDSALAAEYVLRLLDPAEQAAFEQRLAYSADLRDDVARWEEEFASLADAEVRPVVPPAHIKTRLMRRIFPEGPRAPLWRAAGLWQALTFASLALAAGLAWQLQTARQQAIAPAPLLVGEIAAETETDLRLLAVYDGADGKLRLNRTDGLAAPGRALELWAIAADEAPVSLGLLSDTAEGAVTLPEPLRGRAAELTLAISDEPAGGSPTGAPTGAILATGGLTDL